MNRRDCLALLGAGGAAAGLGAAISGCDGLRARFAPLHDTSSTLVPLPKRGNLAPVVHLLNRAGFGPAPGDVARVEAMGVDAWIDDQLLAPGDDSGEPDALRLRLRPIESLSALSPYDLPDLGEGEILMQLQQAAILRAVYSPHQLRERMVDFWGNHFNIYAHKNFGTFLISVDDVKVIRTHALGYFPDLLRASAHSPAMLEYLDNQHNRRGVANENYARELMELHSLGVDGGYTQKDVQEVARCLTGWTVEERFLHARGHFRFDPTRHDDGPKTVLGTTIPAGGGEADGDRVLEILAIHPATAHHIARKLVQHFVGSDDPALTTAVATVYRQTSGNIPAMLRGIFSSASFRAAGPALKRPFDYLVSALRATNAETDGGLPLQKHLAQMGQPLYQWPMPDGYPTRTAAWTGTLLHRWNFAVALASGTIKRTSVTQSIYQDRAGRFEAILARRAQHATEDARLWAALEHGANATEQIALLLASPEFQWR